MKIYVAARFHEKEMVRELYTRLAQEGHEITVDWTVCATPRPYSKHQQDAQYCATHGIEGVKNCDAFIFITNPEVGSGSSAELGAALMMNLLTDKPYIYVVGEHLENNLFFYHPAVSRKVSIDEVFRELKLVDTLYEAEKELSCF